MMMMMMKQTSFSLVLLFLSLLSSSVVVVTAFCPTVVRQSSSSPSFLAMMSTTADADAIQTGRVKWFDTTKGFGFIIADNGGPDVFVHQTEIQVEGFRSLAEEEPVEYRLAVDNSGRHKATQVTGPDGSPVQGAPFQPREDYGY